MKHISIRLAVAVTTFLLGITAAYLFHYVQPPGNDDVGRGVETPTLSSPIKPSVVKEEPRNLSPKESRIVAEAEYFVCWNGYTTRQCGGVGSVYFERGDNTDDLDGIWQRRRDTLEAKAYGIMREERRGSMFWTVVFRYTERTGKNRKMIGRAWTVEENRFGEYFIDFSHNFPLKKVERL